ncbi:MAG: glycosyl hydrolase [Prolixibacteraceae bacterium]|jgi:mannan endo-1,4-beta-mannosidase|nr:glycosyl hydrolase [Prolixibacteraceae bacterium]
MKTILTTLVILLLNLSVYASSGEPVDTIEAESGTLLGAASIASQISGYEGSGYVTNLRNSTDGVSVTVNIPENDFYSIYIRYHSDNDKYQNLSVNNEGSSQVEFPATSGWSFTSAGKYLLNKGENTITLKSSWGWSEIDQFVVTTTLLNEYYNITSQLVDPDATGATRALFNYLNFHYRKRIISGQTNNQYQELKELTGQSPLYQVWDFQHYTEGYPYLWKNGGHTFGTDPNAHDVEDAIKWYKESGKKGIIGFQWHWHSPTGGEAGTNTFYTDQTSFDIRKAVVEGNEEYNLIIRDIDAIAVQLKKFQDENIPVLWRPLHEAGGGWFWWGAHGPEACKKLYDIIFDRMKNHHQLHNLIWVWSTPEENWYPGNDKVDIAGHDSYPGAYNYTTQKNAFDNLHQLTGGTKITAMTENGPIPDIGQCLSYDSPWLLFMSWANLVFEQNTDEHLIEVFANENVLTLENDTFPRIAETLDAEVCGRGKATLEAYSNFGEVAWYDSLNGGTLLGTGNTLTTPEVDHTTHYWVEAFNNNPAPGIKPTKVSIFVNSIPQPPVIKQINDSTLESDEALGNQWYLNDAAIDEANEASYIFDAKGDYYSIVTLNGCSSEPSNLITIDRLASTNQLFNFEDITIAPNPVVYGNSVFKIAGLTYYQNTKVKIFDLKGQLIISKTTNTPEVQIDEKIKTGIYIVQITNHHINYRAKLVVE